MMGAYDDILSGTTTEYSLTDSYDSWIDSSMTGAIGAVGSSGAWGGIGYTPNTNLTNGGVGNVVINPSHNLNAGNIMWANVSGNSTFMDTSLVINHKGSKINVGETITMIMDRLCIIEPSLHLHEKYPALKEAYDAYKAIEAMCKAGDDNE